MDGCSLAGVKVIISGIRTFAFRGDVPGVATCGGRLAVVCVDALNGRDLEKQAVSRASDNVDEEPGNGIGIGGFDMGDGFAGDFAAIGQLPTGSGKMGADDFALIIFQLRVGRFERPGEVAVDGRLAGVDLRSSGVGYKDDAFAGRSLNGTRNRGRRNALCVGGDGGNSE